MMDRNVLLQKLKNYKPMTEEEVEHQEVMVGFVENEPDCFKREHQQGHITGSSWIVNPAFTKTLLLHHKKLDRWLQPGGHCDGSEDVLAVAVREAEEETALKELKLFSEEIFDIDIHTIPEVWREPEHLHYDIRFLFEADENADIQREEEKAYELKWLDLEEVSTYRTDESVMRMVYKTMWIHDNMKKEVA